MNNNDLREKLIIPAVVGALYAALTMLLAPISYGNLQFRISEALCVLPVFFPYTSVGLFLGCALANMISAAGILDIIFGSLATLAAAFCTAAIGRRGSTCLITLAGCMMPVVFNAVVVGAELAWAFGPRTFAGFLLQAGGVALGQLFSCFALGLPLVRIIEKTPALRAWFRD